jgi:hypothetical protein
MGAADCSARSAAYGRIDKDASHGMKFSEVIAAGAPDCANLAANINACQLGENRSLKTSAK